MDVTEISVCREGPLVLVKLRVIGRPPIHIGSFYRHPGHKLDELRLLEENMGKIAKNGVLPETIIGGDFNLPGMQWNDPISIKHNPQYGIAVNEIFLEIKDFFGFTQIIKENTRGLNVLDICCVKTSDLYSNINIVPGISDHDAMTVTVNQNSTANHQGKFINSRKQI